MSLSLWLDMPPAALSPNARTHWARKHRAFQKYKGDCISRVRDARWQYVHGCEHQRIEHGLPWDQATATVQFVVTTNRRRDVDNAMASLKACFDAMSGLLVRDDSGLRPVPAEPFFVRGKRAGVRIRMERTGGAESPLSAPQEA